MLIGGLLKFTLIDYPGKIAAVIFTQGCNYRCPFCHNPELVMPELFHSSLDEDAVFSFLQKRRGQLQGIVVTGGEPTLQPDLPAFLGKIKALGYLVKLDTNGSRPDVVRALVAAQLVDYWAMDIKSSPESYARAAGVEVDSGSCISLRVLEMSVAAIKASGVDHEFRTTAIKGFVSPKDITAIRRFLGPGSHYYVRRGSLKTKLIDAALADRPAYTDEEWGQILRMAEEGQSEIS